MGVQSIPAVAMLVTIPFCVGEFFSSIRRDAQWCFRVPEVAHLQRQERTCHQSHGPDGSAVNIAEIEVLEQMMLEAKAMDSGKWIDLFRGNYFRRVSVGLPCVGAGRPSSSVSVRSPLGSSFSNRPLGPNSSTHMGQRECYPFSINLKNANHHGSFYLSMGLGANSFTYQTITNVLAVGASGIALLITDKVGRRTLLIIGTFSATFFNCIVAGIGERTTKTQGDVNMVVASFILLYAFIKLSLASQACEYRSVKGRQPR